MFQIAKTFSFSATHRLLGLPAGHPCGRLHGHNYEATFAFQCAALDERGFCQVDYRELDPLKSWIDSNIDHCAILSTEDPLASAIRDEWPGQVYLLLVNPSAENLAMFLYYKVKSELPDVGAHLRSVRVSETPKTWAEYTT